MAAKKAAKGAQGADALDQQAAAAMKSAKPFVKLMLQDFDEQMALYKSIDKYLDETYPKEQDTKDLMHKMDDSFVPDPEVSYSTDMDPGKKRFRVWQYGYHKNCGNSGVVHVEDARNLLTLVLVNGFKTNADLLPGAEKIIATKLQPEWFDDFDKTYPMPKLRRQSLPGLSLGQVTGWKIICVARRGVMNSKFIFSPR